MAWPGYIACREDVNYARHTAGIILHPLHACSYPCPRFTAESVFSAQSVMFSPRFVPQSVLYTQSVVRSLQFVFYTDRSAAHACMHATTNLTAQNNERIRRRQRGYRVNLTHLGLEVDLRYHLQETRPESVVNAAYETRVIRRRQIKDIKGRLKKPRFP